MPPRSRLHRLLTALFRMLSPALLRAELLIADAARFGIDPFHDIARLAVAWKTPLLTIFDVGANDGTTALQLHRRFQAARIFCFEPHPPTFARLIADTKNLPQILATNTAVGEATGSLPLTVYTESRVNTLRPGFHAEGRFQHCDTINVPVTTVDDFCTKNHIDSIDLLKIDTEGFDLMVLRGAATLLAARTVRFIYVECNDLQTAPGQPGTGLTAVDAFLRPFGYRFIATYNDYNNLDGRLFQSSNALFALPPEGR